MEFYYALSLLFGGQFVPLSLMPPVIQQIALFLPFQLFLYFPIQIILGNLSPDVIVRTFITGLGWLVVAVVCFLVVWRNGLKRYSAVGA